MLRAQSLPVEALAAAERGFAAHLVAVLGQAPAALGGGVKRRSAVDSAVSSERGPVSWGAER